MLSKHRTCSLNYSKRKEVSHCWAQAADTGGARGRGRVKWDAMDANGHETSCDTVIIKLCIKKYVGSIFFYLRYFHIKTLAIAPFPLRPIHVTSSARTAGSVHHATHQH